MKLLILGDSHGNPGVLKRIVERERPFDLLIHLGDGAPDLRRVRAAEPFVCDAVQGNNDPSEVFPEFLALRCNGRRCLFAHGHTFEVHRDLRRLADAGARVRATMVFFGHTHTPGTWRLGRIRLFNPGSVCSYLTPNPGYLVWEEASDPVWRRIGA